MKILLMALLVLSCSGVSYFEVQRARTDKTVDAALCLEALGWDVEVATNLRVETSWHRFYLGQSSARTIEVQLRIKTDLQEGVMLGLCTQRSLHTSMGNESWRFRPCSDARALRMVDNAIRMCGNPSRLVPQ